MGKRLKVLLVTVAVCAAGSLAALSQTTRIDLSKSGNDVQLSMSDTSGPWHVVRSMSPTFNYNNVLLADATTSNPLTDAAAATLPELWFYDASDTGAGETPADDGQPSEGPLVLISLSPNEGWDNQSITINGTGFSTEPTDNHPFFGVLPATVTAATSTSLTVTVPAGVTTGPVIVQRSGVTSNALTFTAVMESNYSGNAFQNISSIVFNDRTTDPTSSGHLFFSDMGTGATSDYLYEVMDDYSLAQRIYWNEMKGLPMDPSGNLYLANTTLTGNAGLIKKYETATQALTTYTNAKRYNETDSVSVVGVVYRPDGVIFAANRYDNTIRIRVPANPGAGIFVSGYTVDLYMGMAMDSATILYFTSGGTLYKTPTSGSASVTTVATGFANASGIAIDESTGNTLMLLADRGAGKIYLLNPQTGYMDLVGSGFNSPRAVAFGKDKATGELYYYVAEATRILRLPDPRIKVDSNLVRGNIKVLISKRGPGGPTDTYPCSLQTVDAQVRIPFDVDPKPTVDTWVYLKLYDPKDTGSYATTSTNDNRDPARNGATEPGFQGCLSTTSVKVAAGTTHGEAILTISNQYAGDNYYVGFSFDPNFIAPGSTIKPLAKTGILTAWKRLYVEQDKMYKQGGLLSDDVPATATNTIYLLKDPAGIQPDLPACSNPPTACGYQIVVFDADHPVGSPGSQTAWVTNAIDDPTPGANRMILTLDHNLSGTAYLRSPSTFASGKCGGIGVLSAGFYEANGTPFTQRMRDACEEVKADTTQNSILPLISWVPSFSGNNHWKELAEFWRDPLHLTYTRDNHIQLIGIENNRKNSTDLAGITPGDTAQGLFSGASFIFVQSLMLNGAGYLQDQINVTSMHEETHNCAVFCSVNNSQIYHCTNPAYTPPSDSAGCYMHLNPYVVPGVLSRLCLNHVLTGGGGIVVVDTSIRDQVDPIP